MRFLFVDRIERSGGDAIHGAVRFAADAPLRYPRDGGEAVVAPGAISEAIGQLASWLCLQRNDFTARPVFLFADSIRVEREVPVGTEVALCGRITTMDAETFVFDGEAMVAGEIVQSIRGCNGYFMPLAELEDPAVTRQRFQALTSGGLTLEDTAGPAFPFAGLVLEVLKKDAGEIEAAVHFAEGLPFYKDHFPRFPVTPIVMLNEAIGAVATKLLAPNAGEILRAKEIDGIKIRSFVKPGETLTVKVKVARRMSEGDRIERIETVAELAKEGKRLLRGAYSYELAR